MSALVLRAVLLAVVLVGAYGLVAVGERRRGHRRVGLPEGLVLVTGPDCRLCEPARQALRAAGAVPRLVDVADLAGSDVTVTSLPVALLVGPGGEVIARRAGRSVIADAALLAGRLQPAG